MSRGQRGFGYPGVSRLGRCLIADRSRAANRGLARRPGSHPHVLVTVDDQLERGAPLFFSATLPSVLADRLFRKAIRLF